MISVKDVEHVAKLARLALSEEEKRRLAEQLGHIMDYFHALNEVDTEGVAPLAHILPIANVMREDEVKVLCEGELLLENAPDCENGFFKVPKIE